MTWKITAPILGCVTAGLILSAVWSAAAQDNGSWRLDIREEARETQRCEISYFSHVVERMINGKAVVMAKIHCEDSRAFDAIRDGENAFFTFTKCRERNERAC
jgi:hypothetical protein